LGKAKGKHENNSSQEKGWNYRCRAKETFSTDEGSMGGEKKSCRSTVDVIADKNQ
jgi:hypothetical protein